ncbi:hypothetical protein CO051_01770 [Candidatus Roizmanbacteria bacterium CG_4_9_14_0_2_um_filter_39_13]|uniref:Polymerase beta nucleotidyltransferase domain-containing protein n=1 Tax=Candidatus Roizmanbacteria bacterium CG_4_9_14_0_2_um_filter_39_13 TaxID=1974839 RepID=A0A2M8F1T5_9BACT|nr:MAG: hypothetical protein CO051_01770 [Candidatus Roizmanbacteria bacterium CG_4_9_14_0_2_um_filter_39_13]
MLTVKQVQEAVIPILHKYQVKRASLFGSIVHGTNHEKSDVDILVSLPQKYSLYDFITVKNELEDKLQNKVDLVEFDNIRPYLKEQILSSQISIIA